MFETGQQWDIRSRWIQTTWKGNRSGDNAESCMSGECPPLLTTRTAANWLAWIVTWVVTYGVLVDVQLEYTRSNPTLQGLLLQDGESEGYEVDPGVQEKILEFKFKMLNQVSMILDECIPQMQRPDVDINVVIVWLVGRIRCQHNLWCQRVILHGSKQSNRENAWGLLQDCGPWPDDICE